MPSRIPVEFVFNPNWWNRHYGISFDASFYLDRQTRIDNDVRMRAALYDRFGWGDAEPRRRPVLGSPYVAGGFVIPALFGIEIRFTPDAAPWPVPAQMSRSEILALKPPVLERTWPMDRLMADACRLQGEFGYVVGDLNTDGILNAALQLRGQELYLDMHDDPEAVLHLFDVLAQTIASVAEFLRRASGTCSLAVNRSIANIDPRIFLQSNCSVQMISPALYRRFLLPYELRMAARLRPYGVHHCGDNMHLYAADYAALGGEFFDVGWGADVARCRKALPDAFLNLRLSPVRLQREDAAAVRADVNRLLRDAGDLHNLGLCCINMDYGTPDENVLEVLRARAEIPAHLSDAGRP